MRIRSCANTSPGNCARNNPTPGARPTGGSTNTSARPRRTNAQPTLEDLQPLYQAVAHGCQAGLQQEACDKVYFARILRRERESTASKKLGAFGSDLGAVACFFEPPWSRVSPALTEADQAWLLNEAAFCLRALGRLTEALEPMRAGMEMARQAGGLEERRHQRQQPERAGADAGRGGRGGGGRRAVRDLRRPQRRCVSADGKRTTHADALHQAGRRAEAETRFREAEQMQAERQPDYPLLYSLRGFRYCDLLLAAPERAAWQSVRAARSCEADGTSRDSLRLKLVSCMTSCRAVSQRAAQTLKWVTEQQARLLDIALDHLTLGRAALYAAILEQRVVSRLLPTSSSSRDLLRSCELDAAVAGLRRAGRRTIFPAASSPAPGCGFSPARAPAPRARRRIWTKPGKSPSAAP